MNPTEFLIFTCPRSGSHAIHAWLYSLITLKTGTPPAYFENISIEDNHFKNHQESPPFFAKFPFPFNQPNYLTTFENKSISFAKLHSASNMQRRKGEVEIKRKIKLIGIYRTYGNTFASQLALNDLNKGYVAPEPKQMALDWMDNLNRCDKADVTIVYCLWHTDRSYRDFIADNLGLDNSTDPRHTIIRERGEGSSFDKDGAPESFGTLTRWQMFQDDPRWIEAVKYVEEINHERRY